MVPIQKPSNSENMLGELILGHDGCGTELQLLIYFCAITAKAAKTLTQNTQNMHCTMSCTEGTYNKCSAAL